ncbi:MAG: hypothetical protein ABIG46_05070 [Candidatus Omnitrophota bacterium]
MESVKIRSGLLIYFILITLIFLFCILPKVNKPIMGWEVYTWQMAESIEHDGLSGAKYFYNTPLYALIISFFFKAFGVLEVSARLPGIIAIIMMPVFLLLFIRELTTDAAERKGAFVISSLIFLLSPVVVQGSLVIDLPDTTLLMFAVSVFFLYLAKSANMNFAKRALILGLIYFLCIALKMTTSLACVISIAIAGFFLRDFKKYLYLSFVVFGVGVFLHIFTWFLLCVFFIGLGRFYEPFRYYYLAASSSFVDQWSFMLPKIAQDVLRIYLWFSPFFIILAFLAFKDTLNRIYRKNEYKSVLPSLIFIIIVVSVYLVANATFSGFPKYLAPVYGILCAVTGLYVYKKVIPLWRPKFLISAALLIFLGGIYYNFFIRDGLYSVYILRSASLAGRLAEVIPEFVFIQLKLLLLPVFIFIILRILFRMSAIFILIASLLTSLLAGNIALNLEQRRASYSTNYAYGIEGAQDLKDYLQENAPLAVYSSVEGFLANTPGVVFLPIYPIAWDNADEFYIFLKNLKPQALVYGLATNYLWQLEPIFNDPLVKGYLEAGYRKKVIGAYNVLIRNE